jgi:glycosyltransferase involved in cell wall biosynthesis
MKQASNLFANSFKLCEKVSEISKKECLFLPAITDFKLKKVKTPNIDKRRFNFLYVGRLEPVKGPDILIEAVRILSKQNKKFTINILGDGSMGTSLKEKTVDLKDYVKFFGWANEETVGGFMKTCDCLIIPSRNESLPLVMIEAAKVSLPVIAADVGDCKRMIKKYQLGLTFTKEDAKGLSNAMLKIMTKNIYRKNSKFQELTRNFSQRKAVNFLLSEIGK